MMARMNTRKRAISFLDAKFTQDGFVAAMSSFPMVGKEHFGSP